MATEHVLRLRITKAAEAAQRAVAREDQRAYEQARAAYEAADAALRVLEAERNKVAIEELEAEVYNHGGILPYSLIQRAGVPTVVLEERGWAHVRSDGGMHKPIKPRHLAIVPDEAG